MLRLALLLYLLAGGVSPDSNRELGTITDKQGHVLYHVVAEFRTVQAAKQSHSHSSICFLNSQRIQVAKYEVGLPSELPVKLDKNALYFTYTDKAGEKNILSQLIGNELPKMLCVAPKNCYSKE